MHKEYFLLKLKLGLLPLPEEDRNEILAEYDAHFEFGKQQGRTEEEIAKELGDPEELAVELLGDRDEKPSFSNGPMNAAHMNGSNEMPPPWQEMNHQPGMQHGYDSRWDNGQGNHSMPYPPGPEAGAIRSRTVFGIIGVIFASILIVPFLIAGWGVCIGIGGAAISFLVSPLLYVVKLALGGVFYGAEMSLIVLAFGIGIFLTQVMVALFRNYARLNMSYIRWVAHVGRERR
ncbi:DUF1700 domain-containing protein [Paenibacillus profundus]|uniref:DUF1700 domain-containing protein n=1 Tax=Paenibacillus profundus TaxID=1173085 RepID=A0ABS8YAW9_9BACL|nr:DUF1700 domain-containing protein [Paenibacillus profundus]MCE5168344.1 DUF1700 domain-containing protein [Paenibacillus profundus]